MSSDLTKLDAPKDIEPLTDTHRTAHTINQAMQMLQTASVVDTDELTKRAQMVRASYILTKFDTDNSVAPLLKDALNHTSDIPMLHWECDDWGVIRGYNKPEIINDVKTSKRLTWNSNFDVVHLALVIAGVATMSVIYMDILAGIVGIIMTLLGIEPFSGRGPLNLKSTQSSKTKREIVATVDELILTADLIGIDRNVDQQLSAQFIYENAPAIKIARKYVNESITKNKAALQHNLNELTSPMRILGNETLSKSESERLHAERTILEARDEWSNTEWLPTSDDPVITTLLASVDQLNQFATMSNEEARLIEWKMRNNVV